MTKKHDKHHDEGLNINPEQPPLKEMKPEASALEQKLAEAEKKAQENWELALRTRAELDNALKRAQRQVEDAHKFALEQFTRDLLPIIDSLEHGLQTSGSADELASALKQGMEITLKMFLDLLRKFHVEVVDPLHKPFDPTHHEAMIMQPTADFPPNTVITVVQKGYMLHGRLVRPARVLVAKSPD